MGELYELILYPSFSFLLIPVLQGPGSLILTAKTWGFTSEGEAQKESLKKKKYNFLVIFTI